MALGYNPEVQLRVAIIGLGLALAILGTPGLLAAQPSLADDLLPSTADGVDSAVQTVLDYEPQLADKSTTGSRLKEILASPEYQGDAVEVPPGESWLEQFTSWLSKALGGLSGGSSNTFGLVAISLLIGLLVFLLARLVWNMFGGRRFASDAKQPISIEQLSAVDLVAQAANAATRGDYQLAVRLRFKAVLSSLNIPSSTVLTNTQVLARLKRNLPFAAKPFAKLAGIFEETWYGQQPCGATEYQLANQCAGEIEQGPGGLVA